MLDIFYSNQFKRDFKKLRKLPILDLKIIFEVISTLENEDTLDIKYRDHELIGHWSNFRECHIKPDLLLIYKKQASTLQLARIGSHNELF